MTKEDAVAIVSEIRSDYNFFDKNEETEYRALSMAIEALKAEPEIIYCKDCVRHNVAVKDWYDDHEKKVCPLVEHRGKAQGHEFDYQFCVYGERKEQ